MPKGWGAVSTSQRLSGYYLAKDITWPIGCAKETKCTQNGLGQRGKDVAVCHVCPHGGVRSDGGDALPSKIDNRL